MPSRSTSCPACAMATWAGSISTSPTPLAATVTADGTRDRARASAAIHFAVSAGSCGKASNEKVCHWPWAVIGGQLAIAVMRQLRSPFLRCWTSPMLSAILYYEGDGLGRGRVYSNKSGSGESNDVKPSDDELGFLSCQEIVDYCLDFLG